MRARKVFLDATTSSEENFQKEISAEESLTAEMIEWFFYFMYLRDFFFF